jgi:hypothetical protein
VSQQPDEGFLALFRMLPPTEVEFPPEDRQRFVAALEALCEFIWAPDGTRRARQWSPADLRRIKQDADPEPAR